jgi:regulator of protease activity HflC (stomatin/prohibitin superfamily)
MAQAKRRKKMLEQLLNFLAQAGSLFSPIVMVHPWQGAVILRKGKYHKTLEPGYYLKWPFIEDAIEVDTCVTTLRLPPQSITTKDGVEIVVSSIVKYQIRDLKPYVCDVYDQKDVLADVSMGAVGQIVKNSTYIDLTTGSPEKEVIDRVRKEVNQFGFSVLKFTFTDFCRAKSLRLVQALGKDLDN